MEVSPTHLSHRRILCYKVEVLIPVIFDRDTGLFTKGNIDLETLARQVAEEEIEKAATEDGILDQAQTNAEYYLSRLFQTLGYPQVIFVQE